MALTFPSEEWVEEYKKQINLSEGYKKAAATWTAGVVALVISAKPEIGLKKISVCGSTSIKGFAGRQKELALKKPRRHLSVSSAITPDGNKSSKKSWSR